MSKPGYAVTKLAKMLQAELPARNGLAVIWKPENVFPAKGYWRSQRSQTDTWAWEAHGIHYRDDGSEFVVYAIGSYQTITEIIKHKRVEYAASIGEVYGTNDD